MDHAEETKTPATILVYNIYVIAPPSKRKNKFKKASIRFFRNLHIVMSRICFG